MRLTTDSKRLIIIALSYFCLQSIANAANPIEIENQKPGTRDWVMDDRNYAWRDVYDGVHPIIKGYMSTTSVNKGEQISFKVSVEPANDFTIKIYRMGYYGGNGGRLMTTIGPLAGSPQSSCLPNPPLPSNPDEVVDCKWPTSYTLNIPSTWTSGIYLGVLARADDNRITSGTIFVVRDDSRAADFLYQQPVTNYQAYNHFPLGYGRNLYDDGNGGEGAYKVSFNRPYQGDTKGYSEFLLWELNLVKWLEKNGYNVTYSTDMDTHTNGRNLLRYRAFLSTGHDEYWSKEMRDAVETARNNGVDLAFFGANAAYWQVRFEPDEGGIPNRIMVCYKGKKDINGVELDTIEPKELKTDLFRNTNNVNRPEQKLLGVQFITYNRLWNNNTYQPLVVKNTSHWAFKNSGLRDGDRIPGIVGYEIDTIFPGLMPPNNEFTVLAESPFPDVDGITELQNSVLYRTTTGGWVFSAGTMSWSWALDYDPVNAYFGNFTNTRLQRVTQNILNRYRK